MLCRFSIFWYYFLFIFGNCPYFFLLHQDSTCQDLKCPEHEDVLRGGSNRLQYFYPLCFTEILWRLKPRRCRRFQSSSTAVQWPTRQKVDTLKRIVSRIGLCINIGKRKYMPVYDLSRNQLVLNDNTVEQGDIMPFVYLGSVVTKEGNTLPD